jgi:hypothetical protein
MYQSIIVTIDLWLVTSSLLLALHPMKFTVFVSLVVLLPVTLMMDGHLKSIGVAPMEQKTPAPCFTVPRGEPQKPSDIDGLLPTHCRKKEGQV